MFENAKLVFSGLFALLLNWNCPIQLPPRASLFIMNSKWPPNFRVWWPRFHVRLSRMLSSES